MTEPEAKRHFAGYLRMSKQTLTRSEMADLFETFRPYLTDQNRYLFVAAAVAELPHDQLLAELQKLDDIE